LAGSREAHITCELLSPGGRDEGAGAILESIAGGDQLAFWTLWLRHQEHLFSVCLRQMRGIHADAEDALSRAMLRALDKMPRYADQLLDPKAWLTRLTYNVCVETHREHSRRLGKQKRPQGADIDYERARFLGGSPEEDLLRGELFNFLKERIEGLGERLRQPFILRFINEMSCGEVAAELGLSNENVRKRIQQAKIILRQDLVKYFLRSIGTNESSADHIRVVMPTCDPTWLYGQLVGNWRCLASYNLGLHPPWAQAATREALDSGAQEGASVDAETEVKMVKGRSHK
jgi:RNA polymerase sigma-70 factor (ECF subfamily)